MPKNDLASKIVLGIVALVLICIAIPGILYFGSILLRPYFIFGTIFFGIITVIFGVMLFRMEEEDVTVLGIFGGAFILTAISVIGLVITTGFINDIPSTTQGNDSIGLVNDTIALATVPGQIVSDLNLALRQQSEEICRQYSKEACFYANSIISSYETSQEFIDWINQGKTVLSYIEKVDKKKYEKLFN